MSNILKYLPAPSDYAVKVANVLDNYQQDTIYAVGSGARKALYGLKNSPNGYDFILSYVDNELAVKHITENFESEFPGKVKSGAWGTPNAIEVDCESFTLKVRVQPIDAFLRSVRFAGDAVAVCIEDGRPICMPEFMSLPPVVSIIKTDEKDAQNDKEWVDKHIVSLAEFQKELYEMVNGQIAKEATDDARSTTQA